LRFETSSLSQTSRKRRKKKRGLSQEGLSFRLEFGIIW
jgi:hypothetical protein